MSVQIRRPTARTCERCGRTERWDTAKHCWQLQRDVAVGNTHCIHEWDINGTFYPFD